MRTVRKQLKVVVVAAAALAAAAACSSPSPSVEEPRVATIAKTGSGASAAPSATSERPRGRLDSTDAELADLRRPWIRCMEEHGGAGDKTKHTTAIPPQQDEAARRICDPRYLPLPPWEEDPANPEAKDFFREVVKCLKSKGVEQVSTDRNGLGVLAGGPDNDARSIALTGQYLQPCELKASGRR